MTEHTIQPSVLWKHLILRKNSMFLWKIAAFSSVMPSCLLNFLINPLIASLVVATHLQSLGFFLTVGVSVCYCFHLGFCAVKALEQFAFFF